MPSKIHCISHQISLWDYLVSGHCYAHGIYWKQSSSWTACSSDILKTSNLLRSRKQGSLYNYTSAWNDSPDATLHFQTMLKMNSLRGGDVMELGCDAPLPRLQKEQLWESWRTACPGEAPEGTISVLSPEYECMSGEANGQMSAMLSFSAAQSPYQQLWLEVALGSIKQMVRLSEWWLFLPYS